MKSILLLFHSVTSLFFRTTLYSLRVIIFLLLTHYSVLPTLLHAQVGWKPDQRLVFLPGGGWDPRAVCYGDTIHLVWYQRYTDTIPHEEVFYKRSTDAGETWGVDVLLSVEDTQTSILPQIAVSGNVVHVIWAEEDFGLLYRRSIDGGSIWQDIDSIIFGMGYSSIQAYGDTIYIGGVNGSTGDLRFAKSTDGGDNWTPAISITPASSNPTLRCISRSSLNLIISYSGFPLSEVYHVRSYNGGESWSDSQMISENDSRVSYSPAMDTDDSIGIHITWYDHKYSPYPWTGDIFYRVSRDSGNFWDPIDSLTTQHRAVVSDILAESNNLHLVWEDDRHDFGDNFEIYYRMSTDLGQTWGNEVRLTDAINWSRMPSLACYGNYLHLFWRDCRDSLNNGIGFIYYKRKDISQGITEIGALVQPIRSLFDVYPTLFTKDITIRQSIPYEGQREQPLSDNAMPYALCIKLYDVSGKEMIGKKKREMENGRIGEMVHIDTKNLPCGVYFVELQIGSMWEVHKVVKIK